MSNIKTYDINDLIRDLERFCDNNDITFKFDILNFNCDYRFIFYSSSCKHKFSCMVSSEDAGLKTKTWIMDRLVKEFEMPISSIYIKDAINSKYGSQKEDGIVFDYADLYKAGSLFGKSKLEIKDVKFSGPCTIVFWSDGDKTVVHCGENDSFDKEKGLAMAIAKKFMGTNKSKSNYCDIFKKWIPENDDFSKYMNPPEEPKQIDNLYSVKLMAEKEGVSESAIHQRIKAGKYPGAFKNVDGFWMIPIYKEGK